MSHCSICPFSAGHYDRSQKFRRVWEFKPWARSTGIAMKTVLRGWKSGFFRSFLGAKYRNCTVFGTSSRDNQDLSALSSSSRTMGGDGTDLGCETGGFAACGVTSLPPRAITTKANASPADAGLAFSHCTSPYESKLSMVRHSTKKAPNLR